MAQNFAESPFERADAVLQRKIQERLVRRRFKKRQTIFAHQQPSSGLHWLRSGVVLTTQSWDDGRNRYAIPFYWGLWGAPSIYNEFHCGSCIAASDCVVDALPREAVLDLTRQNGMLAELMARWMSDDFILLMLELAAVNVARTEDKVLNYLNIIHGRALQSPIPVSQGPASTIAWPFTVTQLAGFIDISRPHLSGILNQLKAENKIMMDGGRMAVLPGGLRDPRSFLKRS